MTTFHIIATTKGFGAAHYHFDIEAPYVTDALAAACKEMEAMGYRAGTDFNVGMADPIDWWDPTTAPNIAA